MNREKDLDRAFESYRLLGFAEGMEMAARIADEMPAMQAISEAHVRATKPKDVAEAIRQKAREMGR